MPRLIIVAGASGAGKSFLLEQITFIDNNVIPIKKLSTRKARPYETNGETPFVDLIFDCKRETIKNCDYKYTYQTEMYGINKKDIKDALKEGKDPILIIRNNDTIRELKADFPNSIVFFLQSSLSGEDLAGKLREQGRDDIDIDTRMKRIRHDYNDYIDSIFLFDHVLLNIFEPDPLILQLQKILRSEREKQRIIPYSVFVLMSFNPEMNEIYEEIKDAAELVSDKLQVNRIDKQKGDYKITNEILKCISEAELVVCDLTEERPNVYYELGYARGLNKTVISCAKSNTKIHFDIKDFRTLYYCSATDLRRKLKEEFSAFYFEKKC